MARYYAGTPEDSYASPHNGEAVKGPVLELDTGDAFLVEGPDTFVPLTQAEILLYAGYQQMVTAATEIAARQAAAAKIDREAFRVIASSALRLQQRLLATTQPSPGGTS